MLLNAISNTIGSIAIPKQMQKIESPENVDIATYSRFFLTLKTLREKQTQSTGNFVYKISQA